RPWFSSPFGLRTRLAYPQITHHAQQVDYDKCTRTDAQQGQIAQLFHRVSVNRPATASQRKRGQPRAAPSSFLKTEC
ncbi:hypothetical protein OAC01_01590, partial [bacterium]|nr:hypothetical protein [bacterium]